MPIRITVYPLKKYCRVFGINKFYKMFEISLYYFNIIITWYKKEEINEF